MGQRSQPGPVPGKDTGKRIIHPPLLAESRRQYAPYFRRRWQTAAAGYDTAGAGSGENSRDMGVTGMRNITCPISWRMMMVFMAVSGIHTAFCQGPLELVNPFIGTSK